MAIARVSVLEFDSAEASTFAQESHKKQRARVFPHMQMCLKFIKILFDVRFNNYIFLFFIIDNDT